METCRSFTAQYREQDRFCKTEIKTATAETRPRPDDNSIAAVGPTVGPTTTAEDRTRLARWIRRELTACCHEDYCNSPPLLRCVCAWRRSVSRQAALTRRRRSSDGGRVPRPRRRSRRRRPRPTCLRSASPAGRLSNTVTRGRRRAPPSDSPRGCGFARPARPAYWPC